MINKKLLSILILSMIVLSALIVFVHGERSNSEISGLSEAVFQVS